MAEAHWPQFKADSAAFLDHLKRIHFEPKSQAALHTLEDVGGCAEKYDLLGAKLVQKRPDLDGILALYGSILDADLLDEAGDLRRLANRARQEYILLSAKIRRASARIRLTELLWAQWSERLKQYMAALEGAKLVLDAGVGQLTEEVLANSNLCIIFQFSMKISCVSLNFAKFSKHNWPSIAFLKNIWYWIGLEFIWHKGANLQTPLG